MQLVPAICISNPEGEVITISTDNCVVNNVTIYLHCLERGKRPYARTLYHDSPAEKGR